MPPGFSRNVTGSTARRSRCCASRSTFAPRSRHCGPATGPPEAVALRDSRVVGFLLGAPRDGSWGANIWVEAAGHAVEEHEDARDLYATAAGYWVEQGHTRHYVLVPADEALVDAWFRVGFGAQAAHGIREVPVHTEVAVPDGFEIRHPQESEIDSLIGVGLALPRHQQQAPVFSERPVPTEEEERQEWLDTLAGDEEQVLIGYLDDRPVACFSVTSIERSREHTGLARPGELPSSASPPRCPSPEGRGSASRSPMPALRGPPSTTIRQWSRIGGKRTCSPRASGPSAASAACSSASTVRSPSVDVTRLPRPYGSRTRTSGAEDASRPRRYPGGARSAAGYGEERHRTTPDCSTRTKAWQHRRRPRSGALRWANSDHGSGLPPAEGRSGLA